MPASWPRISSLGGGETAACSSLQPLPTANPLPPSAPPPHHAGHAGRRRRRARTVPWRHGHAPHPNRADKCILPALAGAHLQYALAVQEGWQLRAVGIGAHDNGTGQALGQGSLGDEEGWGRTCAPEPASCCQRAYTVLYCRFPSIPCAATSSARSTAHRPTRFRQTSLAAGPSPASRSSAVAAWVSCPCPLTLCPPPPPPGARIWASWGSRDPGHQQRHPAHGPRAHDPAPPHLAHPRLPQQDWVVLGAPRQDLLHSQHLHLTPNDGVGARGGGLRRGGE